MGPRVNVLQEYGMDDSLTGLRQKPIFFMQFRYIVFHITLLKWFIGLKHNS